MSASADFMCQLGPVKPASAGASQPADPIPHCEPHSRPLEVSEICSSLPYVAVPPSHAHHPSWTLFTMQPYEAALYFLLSLWLYSPSPLATT
jgi:hypothetical protein